jgi:hypothetical protein
MLAIRLPVRKDFVRMGLAGDDSGGSWDDEAAVSAWTPTDAPERSR